MIVVVVPLAKVDPDGGPATCVMFAEQLSVATGFAQLAVAVHAGKTMFPEMLVNTGACISFTVTV
jgi:hypothetical protein